MLPLYSFDLGHSASAEKPGTGQSASSLAEL